VDENLIVDQAPTGTLSLGASEERQDFAIQMAHLKSLEQIEARQHEGSYKQVSTINQAVNLLSAEERTAIFDAGEPTEKMYPNEVDRTAARQLYEQCIPSRMEEVD
jgi:hypothetical protein